MIDFIEKIRHLLQSPYGIFKVSSVFIIVLCACAVFTSIIINFVESRYRPKPERQKTSIVATATMMIFFICFYLAIRLGIGSLEFLNLYLQICFVVIGLGMIIAGSLINIRGRLLLGRNWADQIKIYNDQTMITKGIYRSVRHPLYASLMLMFYGGSIVYLNWFAFLANTVIFIPFMYYRAKQEEVLLTEKFPQYQDYQKKVGMFFPKVLRRRSR